MWSWPCWSLTGYFYFDGTQLLISLLLALQAYRNGHLKRQQPGQGPGSAAQCPFNANHQPAAPFNSKYP